MYVSVFSHFSKHALKALEPNIVPDYQIYTHGMQYES